MTPGYFAFRVGDLDCAAVSAGTGRFRVTAFFADVPPAELQPVLDRHGIGGEKIDTPLNCLLIRHSQGLLLIDTGTKPDALLANLGQQGIVPADMNFVLLSHAHSDHMGGALTGDQPTFPNARYLASRAEWKLSPIKFTLLSPQLIEPDTEILAGVRVIAAPGHTPGQLAVRITSRGETLLYTADVIAHPIHLERPDWNIVSDTDRALARQTRAALLGQAVDQGWRLFVYHFPFPGLCRIARDGGSWRMTESLSA